jgi:hypothetical protein
MPKVGERVRNPHLKDEYYVASVVEVDGCKCTIYRPILTDYERRIREKTAAEMIASVFRNIADRGEWDLYEEKENGKQQENIAG